LPVFRRRYGGPGGKREKLSPGYDWSAGQPLGTITRNTFLPSPKNKAEGREKKNDLTIRRQADVHRHGWGALPVIAIHGRHVGGGKRGKSDGGIEKCEKKKGNTRLWPVRALGQVLLLRLGHLDGENGPGPQPGLKIKEEKRKKKRSSPSLGQSEPALLSFLIRRLISQLKAMNVRWEGGKEKEKKTRSWIAVAALRILVQGGFFFSQFRAGVGRRKEGKGEEKGKKTDNT